MQILPLAAAFITVLVGIVHSVLGERIIFSKLRTSGWVPTEAAPPLRSRDVKILWATWHLASVFGFGFAAILLAAAAGAVGSSAALHASTLAFVGGAILVLVATRGRHPGWIGLLAAAVLAGLSGPA